MRNLALILLLFVAVARGEDTAIDARFRAAQAAFDASDWTTASQRYSDIEATGVAESQWARQHRHQRAYALFQVGQQEQAAEAWGRLVCENRGDELGFRVSFNLALAQQRLGHLDIAYVSLLALAPESVIHEKESSQRAYFQLAGELAEQLTKYDVAAAVYAAAGRTLESPANRAFFAAKLKAVPKSKTAVADVPAEPREIPGLVYQARDVERVSFAGGGSAQRLELEGRFSQKDWTLYCGGSKITPDEAGKFRVTVDIYNGGAAAPFFAFGPEGKFRHQLAEYYMTDWSKFRAPSALPDAASSSVTAVEEEHGDSAYTIRPGVGYTSLSIQDPAVPSFGAGGWEARLAFGARSDSGLGATVRGRVFGSALGQPASEIRYWEGALDFGQRIPLSDTWRLDIDATMGLWNFYGPVDGWGMRNRVQFGIGPTFSWRADARNELGIFLRAAGFAAGGLSTDRRLISTGLQWTTRVRGIGITPGVEAHLFQYATFKATQLCGVLQFGF